MAGAGWICSVRLWCQIDTAFLAVRRLQHEFDAAADGAHVADDGGEEHIVGAFDFRDGVLRHTGPGCDILLGGLHGLAERWGQASNPTNDDSREALDHGLWKKS